MALVYDPATKSYSGSRGEARRLIEVEVGDSKQSALFLPQFKSLHFGNEFNTSARLIDADYTRATRVETARGIEWRTAERIARFYEQATADEDGAFEFEVEYPARPASNVIQFSITTKGLAFHFQPALTLEQLLAGYKRPDDVVGSYAVYATRSGSIVGGKDYRTGKVAHIYRPHATDALGVQVWCALSIDVAGGLMTVTVPQRFLTDATYPVIVDPTFGYTAAGASNHALPTKYASIAAVAEGGTISTIHTYCKVYYGGASQLANAIYSESGSAPSARLAVSDQVTLNASTTWFVTNLSYAFATGTYWLAGWTSTVNADVGYDTVADKASSMLTGTFDTWADPWSDDFHLLDEQLSIYATYAAAATGDYIAPIVSTTGQTQRLPAWSKREVVSYLKALTAFLKSHLNLRHARWPLAIDSR